MKTKEETWKVIPHFHQIADTGDYDGCYEITNGDVSLFTKDDPLEDDLPFEEIIKALNDGGYTFFLDDSDKFENHLLREQLKEKEEDYDKLNNLIKSASESKHGASGMCCSLRESLQKENESLRKQLTWIPVSEKLPAIEQVVLAWNGNEAKLCQFDFGKFNRKTDKTEREKLHPIFTYTDITHWLPIPSINNK